MCGHFLLHSSGLFPCRVSNRGSQGYPDPLTPKTKIDGQDNRQGDIHHYRDDLEA